MKSHLEIEAKYDLADGQQLPDLIGVGGVDAMAARAEMVLTATYFDTPALSLAAAGATLRRRTGGTDDGWHLKLSLADGERLELHRDLGQGERPPAALTALLRVLARSAPLEPVATLVNRRTVHHLLDADGQILAELADDSVVAERHDIDADRLAWRELEIELVAGDRGVLAELDAAVRAGDVAPATGASKLARVLGATPGNAMPTSGVRRKTPVVHALHAGLRQLVLDTLSADPLVRLDRPGAPARMRRAVQGVRANLALQRQVVMDEAIASIRAELTWVDSVVAEVAELDAARLSIRAALAAEPKGLVIGPVARHTDRELAVARRRALAVLRETLDAPRYLDLMDRLVQEEARTVTDASELGRAGDVLPDLADRAVRRAERRIAQLRRAQSEEERRWQLRGAQRAVQRAHYAEQLASDLMVSRDARLVETLDAVRTVLTEMEVSYRTQDVLRELGLRAHLSGENGFTFGRLHGLEQAGIAERLKRLTSLRKQVRQLAKG